MKHTTPVKNLIVNGEPLTIELLKTFEGYESVTEEQAQAILSTIDNLCRAVYSYIVQETIHENNNLKSMAA